MLAVTLRSVSNFISDDGTRDGAYGHEDDFKGFLFDDFEQYWNASPLKYAKECEDADAGAAFRTTTIGCRWSRANSGSAPAEALRRECRTGDLPAGESQLDANGRAETSGRKPELAMLLVR